jgi:hypothetical protein
LLWGVFAGAAYWAAEFFGVQPVLLAVTGQLPDLR